MPTGIYERTSYHLALLDKARKAGKGIKHPKKSIKMIGKLNSFYGKTHSEKAKAKMSSKLRGRKAWNKGLTKENNEIVRRLAKLKIGKKRPKHVVDKIREVHTGRKCSEETRKKLSIKFSGKDNPMYGRCGRKAPNYKGGKSFEPYPPEFNIGLCREIRKRDNYKCKLCDKTEEEEIRDIKRVLSVHHIDYNKNNCKKLNLITLCTKCNSRVNYNRSKWRNYFTTLIKN